MKLSRTVRNSGWCDSVQREKERGSVIKEEEREREREVFELAVPVVTLSLPVLSQSTKPRSFGFVCQTARLSFRLSPSSSLANDLIREQWVSINNPILLVPLLTVCQLTIPSSNIYILKNSLKFHFECYIFNYSLSYKVMAANYNRREIEMWA